MKTKIFTLLLALCAACCFQSCDNDDDNTVKVPAELQKHSKLSIRMLPM